MKQGGIILPDSAVDKQTLHFKDSDWLVILAKGDSRHDGVKIAHEHNCECWALNDIERFAPITMLWEMHPWNERVKKYNPVHLEKDLPVMMQERYLDVPNAIKFPLNAVIDGAGGCNYFNNQICLMLAFAIHTKRFKHIALFGVDYNSSDRLEQEFERPCTEFWMGQAMGRGISMYISPVSNCMTYTGYHKGVVYGYTKDYEKPIEGFKEAQPHYWAEYLLGHYRNNCKLPPGFEYDHDEWMAHLEKTCKGYFAKLIRQAATKSKGKLRRAKK